MLPMYVKDGLLLIIRYHRGTLPKCIIKMLMESLVLSHLNYALPVWSPSLHSDHLCRFHNQAV